MDNIRYYYRKCIYKIAGLVVLLFFQILLLTKLIEYGRIKNSIGIREDSKIDVSQPPSEESSELSSNGFSPDFLLGDLNQNGRIDDEDYELIQKYALHPENLPDYLYDIANVNEDDSFDVRDVSAFRRKYKIGE